MSKPSVWIPVLVCALAACGDLEKDEDQQMGGLSGLDAGTDGATAPPQAGAGAGTSAGRASPPNGTAGSAGTGSFAGSSSPAPGLDAGTGDSGSAAGQDAGGPGSSDAGQQSDAGDAGDPDAGDDVDACVEILFYLDADGDGHGDPAMTLSACTAPEGYVAAGDDCDDGCADCHPGGEELCEGQNDENCDEAVDEGCDCVAGGTRACGSSVGACEEGMQSCVGGEWGTCEDAVGPTAEICDGVDQDCNSVADDTFTNLGDSCAVGVGGCRRTGVYECNASGTGTRCSVTAGTPAPAEICGNGVDDDCDGNTDDFPDLGDSCTAGVGGCMRTGVYECNASGTGTRCSVSAGTPANDEICGNGVDDDCDRSTDEAPATGCCVDAHCASTHRCASQRCVPRTWCEQRSRPSDVAASDYQCLDFDATSSLPGSPWSQQILSSGELTASTARFSSSPASMRSQVSAESSAGNSADRARLSWTASGGSSVSSVSVSARVSPTTSPGVVVDSGWVDLLCIENNARSFCLGHVTMSPNYVGLFVVEQMLGAGVSQLWCPLASSRSLPTNVWTTLELRASSGSTVQVLVNGSPVTVEDCSLRLASDSSVSVHVGNRSHPTTIVGMTVHYDNIVAEVRR